MGLFDVFSKKESNKEKHSDSEVKNDLDQAIEKTKGSFFSKVARAIAGKTKINDVVLDELEEALISADVGVETTVQIIEQIEKRVAADKYLGTSELNILLKEEIASIMDKNDDGQVEGFTFQQKEGPFVVMVVGVNGVGKTTSIGKLANQFKAQGKKVLLGAADTFRAAAIDQLAVWAERSNVDIIKKEMGSDPSAVAYETLQAGVSGNYDIIMIDTAGRLHNKVNLMNELSKIKRVMNKIIPDAPHEVMLVLDASTGQNAIEQAKQFTAATEVSGIVLTKLDGTAKGGVVLGIANQFKIPIRFIGIGEKIEDLQPFSSMQFVESLFR